MAAKTLRKIHSLFSEEISVQKLMKSGGKAAELLGSACAKGCGFPAQKRRICGG
jgi:hypothetical protein